MFIRIWTQNRKFLLAAGSGLAVFLILNYVVNSTRGNLDGPGGFLAKAAALEQQIRALHRELSQSYWEQKTRLEAYEKQELQLRSEIELPPEEEIDKFDEKAPLLQFSQAIDRTWARAREKANQAHVMLPEKLGPQDFGVDRQDGKREYERYYGYLAVVRRALSLLVESGLTEIGRPELVPEQILGIVPGNANAACSLRGVKVQVAGTFDAYLRVLEGAQAPKSFLQVRILGLARPARGDEKALKGELEFVSIRFLEGRDAEEALQERPKGSGRRAGGGR